MTAPAPLTPRELDALEMLHRNRHPGANCILTSGTVMRLLAMARASLAQPSAAGVVVESPTEEKLRLAEAVCWSIWNAGFIPVERAAEHEAARAKTTEALIEWIATKQALDTFPEAMEILRQIEARKKLSASPGAAASEGDSTDA